MDNKKRKNINNLFQMLVMAVVMWAGYYYSFARVLGWFDLPAANWSAALPVVLATLSVCSFFKWIMG